MQKTRLTTTQCKDAGMAAVLLCLLLGLTLHRSVLFPTGAALLLIDMVAPRAFWPFAVVWFNLSELLGAVMSRLLLSVIFLLMVTPVGLVRRMMGIDRLSLRKFKKGRESVMVDRNHTFSPADVQKPY
jgi:hypothetical protein